MAGAECMEVSERPPDVASVETVVPSPLNMTHLRERQERRKLKCKKLGKKLEILDRQIKKCSEAEVTLEEMESGYSVYIKEDLLKRKFVKTWQELCELQHMSDRIVVEDTETSYEGTPYPEINRRIVQRLRKDEFPDYFDIVQILDRCNTKYSLGIAGEERVQLARKVFKDVGKILKRCRHRDFIATFGSHLTDNFTASEDPAEKDESLQRELQLSFKEGEKRMESIVEEFAIKQEQEYGTQRTQEGDSCSANEQEEEEEDEPHEDEEEEEKDNEPQEEKDDEDVLIDIEGEEDDSKAQQLTLAVETDDVGGSSDGVVAVMDRARVEFTADSTTVCVDSPESLVTSTHLQREDEQPGPSGLPRSSLSHISSSSEVVCLDDDDDDDVIILTD